MINISITQIITDNRRIENSADKIFYVLTPNQNQQYYDEGKLLKEHTYVLDCGQVTYDIICPEIKAHGTKLLIVPEFLLLGRPYPVYVYLYGIILYSSNPEMGQREAAEETRKQFGLDTFSHTTLGRAIKRLEEWIKGFEDKAESEESSPEKIRCFPSVEQTHERRDTVLKFLANAAGQEVDKIQDTLKPQISQNYEHLPYIGVFFDVCHTIVRHVFKKYRRLLL